MRVGPVTTSVLLCTHSRKVRSVIPRRGLCVPPVHVCTLPAEVISYYVFTTETCSRLEWAGEYVYVFQFNFISDSWSKRYVRDNSEKWTEHISTIHTGTVFIRSPTLCHTIVHFGTYFSHKCRKIGWNIDVTLKDLFSFYHKCSQNIHNTELCAADRIHFSLTKQPYIYQIYVINIYWPINN